MSERDQGVHGDAAGIAEQAGRQEVAGRVAACGERVLGVVTPRDRCARCLSVIRCCCHVIRLRVASCHVIMCIASSCFQNLHPSRPPRFLLLSVLSPDTLGCTRRTSEILFFKWQENVHGMR